MKIISGGQTGADMGGLIGAVRAKIETGGTAPKGYRTEYGPADKFLKPMGLVESKEHNYNFRTMANINNSDGTVIFADHIESFGTQFTINTCRSYNKPYICNPKIKELKEFIKYHDVKILNVAGNRESVAPGIQQRTADFIYKTFKKD